VALPKGWVEGFELLVYGENENGEDTAMSEGPFRTKADAETFAKAKYPGFKYDVPVTFVETKYTRFKSPRPRSGTKKRSSKK